MSYYTMSPYEYIRLIRIECTSIINWLWKRSSYASEEHRRYGIINNYLQHLTIWGARQCTIRYQHDSTAIHQSTTDYKWRVIMHSTTIDNIKSLTCNTEMCNDTLGYIASNQIVMVLVMVIFADYRVANW